MITKLVLVRKKLKIMSFLSRVLIDGEICQQKKPWTLGGNLYNQKKKQQ